VNDTDAIAQSLLPVSQALSDLGVRHYVGGSVASSFHGAMRSTMDVDLVAEMNDSHVRPFLSAIGDRYYASESAIRDAIRRRSCFNLIHFATSFKVDIFISRNREFDLAAFSRAKAMPLGDDTRCTVPIASAEDIIISKLEWFRLGEESSQRQWDDVSKVLNLLGDAANIDYLRQSAESVDVLDLLERLLATDRGR